jgi:hypothetical protein
MNDIIPEVSRAWGIGLYSPPKYKFMIEKYSAKNFTTINFQGKRNKNLKVEAYLTCFITGAFTIRAAYKIKAQFLFSIKVKLSPFFLPELGYNSSFNYLVTLSGILENLDTCNFPKILN